MNKILIVDVSRHQGSINWQRTAAAGITRAAIRCSVGNYYADPSLDVNWQGAKAAGIAVTVYHAVAPENDYQSQFTKFKNTLGLRECDWPIVLDCELARDQSKEVITNCIQKLASLVETTYGKAPIIYTRQTWWDINVLPWSGWKHYPLWAARYRADLTGPWSDGPKYKFRDWQDWAIWQFSTDGNMRGAEFGASSDSIDLDWLRPDMLGEDVPPTLTLEQRVTNLETWARMNGAILP